MRIIAFIILLLFMSVPLCMANDASLNRAYSLYFQGKMEEAIKIMEDQVKDNPDAKVLYFIGYAYYELNQMDTAMKYFRQAYLVDPDFTPIEKKKN